MIVDFIIKYKYYILMFILMCFIYIFSQYILGYVDDIKEYK